MIRLQTMFSDNSISALTLFLTFFSRITSESIVQTLLSGRESYLTLQITLLPMTKHDNLEILERLKEAEK